ncbi:hypothetical protein [Bacillus sp. OTU530]|uniref:hypothetical protein n=1 Tax=Bacillus sp. OTU530 TaxID=3043862 RepID=UPI00313DEC8A
MAAVNKVSVLIVMSAVSFWEAFVTTVHPLKYLFGTLFLVGMTGGYFRYFMKKKRTEMKQKNKTLSYPIYYSLFF